MARFALYSNSKKLETIEDLKENFTIKDMENNFRTKSLHRWLAEKGFRDELQRIENIPSDGDISILLMECFTLSEEQIAAVKKRAVDDAKRIQEEQKAQEKREKEAFTDGKSGSKVIDIPMPEFSSNDQKVLLASWRVQVGDKVKKGDILCEVETGKAIFEAEAEFDGTIKKLLAQEGEEIDRWTSILRLESNLNEVVISLPWYCTGGIISTGKFSFLVQPGDKIMRGDTLFKVGRGELITEVKSRFEGIISEILVPQEEEIWLKSGDPVIRLKITNHCDCSELN